MAVIFLAALSIMLGVLIPISKAHFSDRYFQPWGRWSGRITLEAFVNSRPTHYNFAPARHARIIIVFALVSRGSLFTRRSKIVSLIARATIVEQSLLAVHWNEYKVVVTLKTPRCHYSNECGSVGLKVHVFFTKNGTIGAMHTCRRVLFQFVFEKEQNLLFFTF